MSSLKIIRKPTIFREQSLLYLTDPIEQFQRMTKRKPPKETEQEILAFGPNYRLTIYADGEPVELQGDEARRFRLWTIDDGLKKGTPSCPCKPINFEVPEEVRPILDRMAAKTGHTHEELIAKAIKLLGVCPVYDAPSRQRQHR